MDVAVMAVGQTSFGEHTTSGVKELFTAAMRDVYADPTLADFDRGRIEAAWVGSLSCGQGMQLGNFAPAMLDHAGLPTVPALHVESACASGGYALHAAVSAVASGQYSCVLAAGVEKMRDVSAERGRYWLGISGDTEYERLAGLTFAGVFALMANRLITDGVITREDLARVAVKNHRHGALNPKAHLRRLLTLEQVLAAPMVAQPLGAFDCCPTSDGAAAVLVADLATAATLSANPVRISGIGAASDKLALHSRPDITRLTAAGDAAARAYRMAGVTPDQVDLAEVHDCFTVAELIAYDELGLCPIPKAGTALAAGEFDLGGRLPVNVSGGLKAKGHPIGATGIGQVVEVVRQLRGDVEPERAVAGARTGLAYNMGGSGASAVVTILTSDAS